MMIKLGPVAALMAICLATGCASTSASSPSPSSSADVAILVLDQFAEAPSPPATASQGNCPASGLQANEVGSTGGGGGLPKGVSHGQAVFATVERELTRSGRTLSAMSPAPHVADPNVGPTEGWTYHGHQVLLVGVNTAGYDTTAIRDNLQSVIDTLHHDMSITRFVLNMSFSIVPCDLASWYNQHAKSDQDVTSMLTSYESYLAGVPEVAALKNTIDGLTATGGPVTVGTLLADPDLAQIRDIVLANLYYGQFAGVDADKVHTSVAYRQLALDPLHDWLANLTHDPTYRVIPVAAAGNGVWLPGGVKRQLPFPTAPAIWNSVVSTSSAALDDPTSLAKYSNNGEVMMSPENPYKGVGTSFAAPHLSALEALYLLNGGPVTCDAHVPPLGYADSDAGVDTWNNLWLGFAAATSGTVPTTGQALRKCNAFNRLAK